MVGASFNNIGSQGMCLKDLAPTGYLTAPWFLDEDQGGCFGEFVVKVLDQSGGTALDENGKEKNYAYYHTYDYDGGEWENDACWKQGSTKITKGAVTFEMGEGLWAYVAASAYTMGFKGKYYLEFPGLED